MKSWFPKEIGGEIYKGFGDEYQSGFVSKTKSTLYNLKQICNLDFQLVRHLF